MRVTTKDRSRSDFLDDIYRIWAFMLCFGGHIWSMGRARPTKTNAAMNKSFLQRRHESPDYEIEAWITGVRIPGTGDVHWSVYIEGEDDEELAAGILERAAEVLRDKS